MAFFLFNGNSLSFSLRLNIIALITILLLCFCSYCSSSSISSVIDGDSSFDDNDIYGIEDEITYYTPLKLSSHRYRNIPEQVILPSAKNQLRNVLLQSYLIPPDYRYKLHNNKRYTSQAFHAVRG